MWSFSYDVVIYYLLGLKEISKQPFIVDFWEVLCSFSQSTARLDDTALLMLFDRCPLKAIVMWDDTLMHQIWKRIWKRQFSKKVEEGVGTVDISP